MRMRLTYGVLPSKEEYEKAFDAIMADSASKLFSFGNCSRMGTTSVTSEELWNELDMATGESESTEASLDWASCVLYVLEIEWV